MRRFRFWLSRLLFEKISGWPNAQKRGEEIIKRVQAWNSCHSKRCWNCGSSEIVEDVSGGDGLFSFPHHFYRCTKCGNVQEDDGSQFKYESEELRKARITEDGYYHYRYAILTTEQSVAVLMLIICGIVGGAVWWIMRF